MYCLDILTSPIAATRHVCGKNGEFVITRDAAGTLRICPVFLLCDFIGSVWCFLIVRFPPISSTVLPVPYAKKYTSAKQAADWVIVSANTLGMLRLTRKTLLN